MKTDMKYPTMLQLLGSLGYTLFRSVGFSAISETRLKTSAGAIFLSLSQPDSSFLVTPASQPFAVG
jgi:hypothetical protein